MIMVDELRRPPRRSASAFCGGHCHLTTDGAIGELHSFAARLGLKRDWFQPHPVHPHYDLSASKREVAVKLGATFVPAREQARRRVLRPLVDMHPRYDEK